MCNFEGKILVLFVKGLDWEWKLTNLQSFQSFPYFRSVTRSHFKATSAEVN